VEILYPFLFITLREGSEDARDRPADRDSPGRAGIAFGEKACPASGIR